MTREGLVLAGEPTGRRGAGSWHRHRIRALHLFVVGVKRDLSSDAPSELGAETQRKLPQLDLTSRG